jgi:hypothetical protein
MYVQHSGCVEKTPAKPISHSTVFVSNFFNLTMFNIGFHLEHHEHPRVHWSELPKLHMRLKQEMTDGGTYVVPYGNYHAAFLLAGDDDAENVSPSRTRDTKAIDSVARFGFINGIAQVLGANHSRLCVCLAVGLLLSHLPFSFKSP